MGHEQSFLIKERVTSRLSSSQSRERDPWAWERRENLCIVAKGVEPHLNHPCRESARPWRNDHKEGLASKPETKVARSLQI